MAHLISARLQPLMPLLIHGSQTAFIQDRCILDNVFTFYAAAEWAKSSSQRLAVLLLDFEKAYDRVDWDFLEGTLTRLGFPNRWIRGVSGLFRSATSAVTIGGFLSRHFTLGRSVRQGCPLAPYLFLFFAEALSSFLCSQSTPIPGLHLPIAVGQQTELLDCEYADDTLLITEFSEDTLDRVRFLIDRFCLASGARVNWNKSSGILFGTDARSDWGVADGFTWLQPGQSCRYLGFQIGLDVTPAQQFTPVLDSIRRKLTHWSACHLSLAGRALVVNQVLLATAWYIASCWMLHPGVISRLRRLVRNYLWAGSDGTHDTRARVAWHTCILPREQGGLGIIDPEMQSRALISKCIIRGLFPGNEPWKSFVRHAVLHSTPVRGGEWSPSYRFIFCDAALSHPASYFLRSILGVWQALRRSIIHRQPVLTEEFERQPIIWNPRIRDAEGRQLGVRTHIDWAAWDRGPTASLLIWMAARCLDADLIAMTYTIDRGVASRMLEIDAAIPQQWIEAITDPQIESQSFLTGWWAFFQAIDSQPSWARQGDFFFVVLPDFRLVHADSAFPLTSGAWHRIRVVGAKGKVHRVDPKIEMDELDIWTLWIWEGRPLSQLSWDPGEWLWPTVFPQPLQSLSSSTLFRLAEPYFSDRSTGSRLDCVLGCMLAFLMHSWTDFGDIYGRLRPVAGSLTLCG